MPIMTERYSNPRWGFLDGLGAAAAPPLPNPNVRIMLIDPATGQFSNKQFEAYKQILFDANARMYDAYNKLMARMNSIGRTSSSTEREAVEQIKANLPLIQKTMKDLTEAIPQFYDGNSPNWDEPQKYQRFLQRFSDIVEGFNRDGERLNFAYDMSFATALGDRALVMIKATYEYGVAVAELAKDSLEKAGRKTKETVDKMVDAAGDLLQTPFDLISFLKDWGPWILGGGFVAFYVMPTVLRARREGSAALEEDLRAGRGAVERGARAAGSAAYRAGKAGAAAYTGNPALLMGAPKRRVQRRRRK